MGMSAHWLPDQPIAVAPAPYALAAEDSYLNSPATLVMTSGTSVRRDLAAPAGVGGNADPASAPGRGLRRLPDPTAPLQPRRRARGELGHAPRRRVWRRRPRPARCDQPAAGQDHGDHGAAPAWHHPARHLCRSSLRRARAAWRDPPGRCRAHRGRDPVHRPARLHRVQQQPPAGAGDRARQRGVRLHRAGGRRRRRRGAEADRRRAARDLPARRCPARRGRGRCLARRHDGDPGTGDR